MKWKGNEKEYFRNYYQTHKEKWVKTPEQKKKRKERRRELYRQEGSTERAYSKKYYDANKPKCLAKSSEWRQKNPDRVRKRKREYYDLNPKQRRPYEKKYVRERSRRDPNYRLRRRLRTRIYSALRGTAKSNTTMRLLGCSIEDLWLYLESKFEEGMTRENYGRVWHVDHIIPCDIFDLTKPEHQKRCFHFSNLQPLFAKDNILKSNKTAFDLRIKAAQSLPNGGGVSR